MIASKGAFLSSLGESLKGGNGGKEDEIVLTPQTETLHVVAAGGSYGVPQTSYGGPKPSGGLSLGLPDLGLGGAGGAAAPDDGYGVPAAPVVASSGGSDGYGAPSNEGYGPSSAVSPFSQALQNNYNTCSPFCVEDSQGCRDL